MLILNFFIFSHRSWSKTRTRPTTSLINYLLSTQQAHPTRASGQDVVTILWKVNGRVIVHQTTGILIMIIGAFGVSCCDYEDDFKCSYIYRRLLLDNISKLKMKELNEFGFIFHVCLVVIFKEKHNFFQNPL